MSTTPAPPTARRGSNSSILSFASSRKNTAADTASIHSYTAPNADLGVDELQAKDLDQVYGRRKSPPTDSDADEPSAGTGFVAI